MSETDSLSNAHSSEVLDSGRMSPTGVHLSKATLRAFKKLDQIAAQTVKSLAAREIVLN